tara:strand:+ start:2530 stop:3405 length:876 start_codon:yes stop_codon:yes gene_type:complete
MKPWDVISSHMPSEVREFTPKKWVKLGKIVLIKIPENLKKYEKELGVAFSTIKGVETVAISPQIKGELREPHSGVNYRGLKVIYGNDTVTEFIEDSVRFRMDLSQVMWSPGNVGWRSGPRGPQQTQDIYSFKNPKKIVDCFAGVGYFTLHLAKAYPESKIIALEKKPESINYLRENVALNYLENVEIREGSCLNYNETADVFHLGYMAGTMRFLPHFINLMNDDSVLLYHEAYENRWLGWGSKSDSTKIPKKLELDLKEIDKDICISKIAKVKSCGESTSHIVARIEKTIS